MDIHQEPQTVAETLEVPDGTIEEILEWVGNDADRREAALAAEKAGQNRKGLIEGLTDG